MKQLEDSGRRVIFALAWQYLNAKQAREIVSKENAEGLFKIVEMSESAMFNLLGQTLAKYDVSYRWASKGRGNYIGLTLLDFDGKEIEYLDLYQEGSPWEQIRQGTRTPIQIMQGFRDLLAQTDFEQADFEQTDFDPEE